MTDKVEQVTITVDGREVRVPAGLNLLQALRREGIHLPSLCHDPRLKRPGASCGLCVVEVGDEHRRTKACITPAADGMQITTDSDQLVTYRKLRLEQLLEDHNADCVAPCQQTCPAGIDIQAYLAHVAAGNNDAALRVIKDRNPFPSVCGRVCPHPCEAACRRNLVDEPVAINNVKRFLSDWDEDRWAPWIPDIPEPTGKTVAIIGAGPSGLTAAYYLLKNGHKVEIFDRQPLPGGMLRYGIPEYRLPKRTLDQEINTIKAMGGNIHCGVSLGTHFSLGDLTRDYDAVYLAIGSWLPTPLGLDGDNRDGIWLGIQYLEKVAKGDDPDLGKEVIVIGGGNTAIDCARTARRKGSHVRLVYRRTQADMPAEEIEVLDAIEEDVEMVFLTAPSKVSQSEDGRLQLHCMKMELGEPDRSGRRRPIPVPGGDFVLEADTVIGAIGQGTNTNFLENDIALKLRDHGDIDVDGLTMQTSIPKIFAGGDCVTGPVTVVQAVGAGRAAAGAIDEFVMTGDVTPSTQDFACSRGTLEDLPRHEFEEIVRVPRVATPTVPVDRRMGDFGLVELTYTEDEARAEASRCLSCGCSARHDCQLRQLATDHGVVWDEPLHDRPRSPILTDHSFIIRDANKCIQCGRCVAACAEVEGTGILGIRHENGRLTIGSWDGRPLSESNCVSCGQCVNACPTGALDFAHERDNVFRAIHDPDKVVVGFIAPAPRSVICSTYGIAPDQASGWMAGAMRQLGFDKVFDFAFSADLTILEETNEFLGRVTNGGVLPHFTSCCPGWINQVEKKHPALIPHLSSCKSPQQMMGATVKSHFAEKLGLDVDKLHVVSIVPCLAKKDEAARPQQVTDGYRDVDSVLSTTEFLEMIRLKRIDPSEVVHAEFDEPYANVTGAGVIFGVSGGVAEASLRLAVEKLAGERVEQIEYEAVRGFEGLKEATVAAGGITVKIAVVSGLANAEPLMQRIEAGEDVGYHLIEVMACPGGCIAGAGNPLVVDSDELEARRQVLVQIDKDAELRRSQDNPDIQRLYEEYFGEPGSDKAHHLLHTHYTPFREVSR